MVYIFYTTCIFIWKTGRTRVEGVQLWEEHLNQYLMIMILVI